MNQVKVFIGVPKFRRRKCRIKLKRIAMVLIGAILAVTLFAFIVFPFLFKYSIGLQRLCVFTNVNLPTKEEYFANYNESGLRNFYLNVKDCVSNKKIYLGAWHLLPLDLINASVTDKKFDYDQALTESNYSTVLYFHGSGEARSYEVNMYTVLRQFFHVIAIDYRSYADSSHALLFEDAVVNDCVQVYKWLLTKTNRIFIWGHSLGSAVASKVASVLSKDNQIPMGLILESPFTSMVEELPLHPYGKLFAWLPWFKATVTSSLKKNFYFNSAEYVLSVDCPIMILHAEDDEVVPVQLGEKLYKIATNKRKSTQGKVIIHIFDASYGYNHYYIYDAPELPEYVGNFMEICYNHRHSKDAVSFILS